MIHRWNPPRARALALALCLPLLAACAPTSCLVKAPTPSAQAVSEAPANPATLALADQRGPSAKTFSSGTLPMALSTDAGPIEGFAFLRTHLERELASRIPGARLADADAALAKHEDEYIRLAAISSLGTLGAVEHFDWLKSLYASDAHWADRAMALKAIGDLGTPAARAFLVAEATRWEGGQVDREARWFLDIIRLYL